MLSSISNSERRRAALVLTCLFAVFAAGNALLYAVFHVDSYQTMAVATLSPATRVLALGSSRVQYDIDARAFRHALTALPANYENLVYEEKLFSLYGERLAAAKSLTTLVLEVDVATIAFDTDQLNPYGTLDLGIPKFAPFSEWLSHFDRSLHRVFAAVFNWRLTPDFIRLWKLRTVEGLEPLAAVPGHIPSKISIPYPDLSAETEVASTLAEIKDAPSGTQSDNEAALVRLVKRARALGLRVLLLRFPLEPALRPRYPTAWDDAFSRAIALLRAGGAIDAGVHVLDLTRDQRFKTENFRDSDHLNQTGAELLAPVVDSALDTLDATP